MKLYWRRDINKTLSSTLQDCSKTKKSTDFSEIRIYRKEYKKRKLAIFFSFWSVFILTRYYNNVII